MKREEIFQYVKEQYGTEPEYLWKKDPDSAVLRHKNGKWYAIIMAVEKKTLGLPGGGGACCIFSWLSAPFFLWFALSPIGEKQGAKRKCFLKNPKIFFRGFFKRRKPQKGGLGVATPTRFPQDKISR